MERKAKRQHLSSCRCYYLIILVHTVAMCHETVEEKLTQEFGKVMETDVKDDQKVSSPKNFFRFKGSDHTVTPVNV